MTKHNQQVVPHQGSFAIFWGNLNVREIMSSISLRVVIPAVFAFMLCLPGNAAADKVDDFKEAATKDGCEAIPYQSERNTCKDRSNNKDKICKDFSIDRADVKKDLETYKEKRKNLQDAKDRKDEQSVRSLEKTVKSLDEKLEGHKKLAKELIDQGYRCLEARELVQRSFSDAKQMVTAETNQALQQYVPNLVRIYEDGRQRHIVPMQQTTTAIENCKWVSEISW
jgi:hypothetical protein